MSAGYVFRAKATNRVRLVFWEGSGVCLLVKPVDSGESLWSDLEDEGIRLAQAQLAALFEGLAWRRKRKLAVGASPSLAADQRRSRPRRRSIQA